MAIALKTIRALILGGFLAGLGGRPALAAPAGDCDDGGDTDIIELQYCINRFLELPSGDLSCTRCDVNGAGGVDIIDLQGVINCFLNPASATCPTVIEPPAVCGDGVRTGAEQCDDGNTYNTCVGGSCCTGNCTLEQTPLVLDLGSEIAMSQSVFFYRTSQFDLLFQPTGAIPLRRGGTTGVSGTTGAPGLDSYPPGQIPVGWLATDPMIDPMEVPGMGCGCLRAREVRTCGGAPPYPGASVIDCTANPNVCPAQQPCRSVHGPGAAASGRIGCSGLPAVDYGIVLDSARADGDPLKLLFDGPTDAGPAGSTLINATFSVGIILGSCAPSPGNPAYGGDGLPCTSDDPNQGTAFTVPYTTGVASAQVRNPGGVQNAPPITCAASGMPVSCDQLPDTAGLSLVAATVEENRVAVAGDAAACERLSAQ